MKLENRVKVISLISRLNLVNEFRSRREFHTSELIGVMSMLSEDLTDHFIKFDDYLVLSQDKIDNFSKPFEFFEDKIYRTGIIRVNKYDDAKIMVPGAELLPLFSEHKFKKNVYWADQIDGADFVVKIKQATATSVENILEKELKSSGYRSKKHLLRDINEARGFLPFEDEIRQYNLVSVYFFSEILTNLTSDQKKRLTHKAYK